jgi:ribosomal protein L37AE/L43A
MKQTTPFEFHTGIEFEEHGDQYNGPCPFCEKEHKFYFNKQNLWDCKSCGKSGNLTNFLREVYEMFDTTRQAAEIVHEWRQIPPGYSSRLGLKYNSLNGSVIIPTTRNGLVHNLYKAFWGRIKKKGEWVDKLRVMVTPSTDHCIMNWPEHIEDTVWIIEGHWDRIAVDAIIAGRPITPLGVPGAEVWNKAWTQLLSNKDIVFCYDNDEAGETGRERVIIKQIAKAPEKPKSVSYIRWQGEDPGWDLNDTWIEFNDRAFDYLDRLIVPYVSPEHTVVTKKTADNIKPNRDIDSFEKLMAVFENNYHITEDFRLCLLLVLASVYSVNIEGEQLWLRIIGPPGAGKTTIAKAISASYQVVLKSTFTGLFSGWHDDSEEDASLIPVIAGKTLVVKDADSLLKRGNVEQIFSELRDFYDKDSSTFFKNRVGHDYRNIRTTMILCGTNVLRRSDQSFLGERFLDFELRVSPSEEEAIVARMEERAIQMAMDPSGIPPETEVQEACAGFIEHLMGRSMTGTIDAQERGFIRRMSKLATKMRTQVDRDGYGKGDITFQPVDEVPSRIVGQLIKGFLCARVVQTDPLMAKKMISKVCTDIIDRSSNRYRICEELMEGWYTRNALIEATGIPKSSVNIELDNLRALHMVEERETEGSRPDRKVRAFTLGDRIKEGLLELDALEG